MSKPHITTKSLPNAIVGQGYYQPLSAAHGNPPYTWWAKGLPPGLKIKGSGIAGAPTKAGTFSVTLEATDMSKQVASATIPLTVVAPLKITTTSLPSVVPGQAYSAQLSASGGTAPLTWSLDPSSPALPSGLSLSNSGLISGTAAASVTPGTINPVFSVSDNS